MKRETDQDQEQSKTILHKKKKKIQRPPLSYPKSWEAHPNKKIYMNSQKAK